MKVLLSTEDKIEEVPIIGNGNNGNNGNNENEGRVQVEARGRPAGRENLPELSKELIRHDRASGMKVEDVARIHGVAAATVTETSKLSEEKKAKIIETVGNKLLDTLEIFEPGALEQKELPAAAARLAGIVEKIQDKEVSNEGTNIQFIVVSPGIRKEEEYRTIEVKD